MNSSKVDRVLLVLLGVSLAFNLSQHGLPDWIMERVSPPKPTSPSPLVGRQLAAQVVRNLAGEDKAIELAGRKTILYVISPKCDWCKANTPIITELAKRLQADYSFVGLSMTGSGLKEYLQSNPLPFETYVIPNPLDESWSNFELGATPYMIAVDTTGKIAGAWMGALAKNNRAAVLKFFRLDALPRLQSSSD